MWMKNVNNFQMAKIQSQGVCCLALAWFFANFSLMLLIIVLLIKKWYSESQSVDWGINPRPIKNTTPRVLAKPSPLNRQTGQGAPFLGNLALYIGFL